VFRKNAEEYVDGKRWAMRQTWIGLAGVAALGVATNAFAQDVFLQHAEGQVAKRGTVCVGPLSPSDAGGVELTGSTDGGALTWQLFSVDSQSAPALVFSSTATSVDHVEPPQGNFLYYGCVTRAPRGGQDYTIDLVSQEGGVPNPAPGDVQQQHEFGRIAQGTTACGGELAPSGADGVQIFGFTNGAQTLSWRVFSIDPAGTRTLAFSTTARNVDQTIPPTEGRVYQACVVRGPATAEDFDLSLNSTTLE
jgi:hypothetical protein